MADESRQSGAWWKLADRVLDGEPIGRDEALTVLRSADTELLDLLAAAFRVRQHYFGRRVQLYLLKNAKSGLCSEDCGYCSQAADSTAEIPRYGLIDDDALLEGARQAVASQARTYCIVSSGRAPTDRDLDRITRVVAKIKSDFGLHLCCSLGLLNAEQAERLKQAGVNRINHNLNTSRRFHDTICTTHSFDDRIETLRVARAAGLELCCGAIVGLGEDDDDVVDVAFEMRSFEVNSIPVNFLHAIPGTRLEGVHRLDPRYCLKVLCLFRFVHPQTEIRIAGGREINLRSLQPMGLYAANSIFVSDYLTTPGQPAEDDFRMIEDLGFEIVLEGHESTVTAAEALERYHQGLAEIARD